MEQPFTVVSDNAEMYAYFSVAENMLRHLATRYGSIDSLIAKMPEVSLQLNDGSPVSYTHLRFGQNLPQRG